MTTQRSCSVSGTTTTYRSLVLLASVFLATTVFNQSFSQWHSFDRLGADFRGLAVSDTVLYAAGFPCALHKSTNNGLTWSALKCLAPMEYPILCVGVPNGKVIGGMTKGGFIQKGIDDYQRAVSGVEDDIQAIAFTKRGSDVSYFLGGFGGGVRRSHNLFAWALTNDGLTNLNVTSLATTTAPGDTNPVLYAGTYGGGVFRSDNEGTSWAPSSIGLENLLVYALVACRETLYAAHGGGWVSQSLDMGATWTRLETGLPTTDIISLAAISVDGVKCVYAGSIDAGVWQYTPVRSAWMPMNNGLKSLRINAVVAKESLLFAATDRGIYRSSDFGSSWQLASDGATPPLKSAYVASFKTGTPATRIFVSTTDYYWGKYWSNTAAVYWTEDLGGTWTIVPFKPTIPGFSDQFDYFAVQHNDCMFLFSIGGTDHEFFRFILSTDRGSTWGKEVEPGFPNSYLAGVLIRDRNDRFDLHIGMRAGNGQGLYRSLDTGKTWTKVTGPGGTDRTYPPILAQDSILYAAYSRYTKYTNPIRTSDGGVTWKVLDFKGNTTCIPPGQQSAIATLTLVHANDDILLANVTPNAAPGEVGGLYASSDYGETWTPAGFRGGAVERVVESYPFLYAMCGGHFYASRGYTFVWKDVTENLMPDSVRVITASPEYVVALTKTSDRIWYRPVTEIQALLDEVPAQPALLAPANGATNDTTRVLLRWLPVGYAESYRLQVSEDPTFSSTMVIDSMSLLDTTYRTHPLIQNHLYYWRVCALNFNGYGPWSATYHFTVSPTATSVEAPAVPTETALLQNYPNPFNPVTKIGYRVSGLGSRVKLAVYDMLGREVAVLVDEAKPAGEYQVKFDGSGFSSGSYIFRMTAGDKVFSRRMLLIK